MELKKTLSNVKHFAVDGSTLAVVYKNDLLQVLSQDLDLVFESQLENNIQNVRLSGGIVHLNDIDGNGYIITKNQSQKLEKYILTEYFESIYCISGRSELVKISKSDLTENWRSKHGSLIHTFDKEHFITRTRKRKQSDILNCIDNKTGNLNWQFDLNGLNEDKPIHVKQFVHITSEFVWVAVNNHNILKINVRTGALICKLSSIKSFSCEWLPSAIPEPIAMKYSDISDVLVGFMWEFYWEINTNNTINLTDLTDHFKSKNIRNDKPNFILDGNHIYFISRNDSKIGRLNRSEKLIDWTYEFTSNNNGTPTEVLELKGNKKILAVLDRSNEIHIFK